MTNQSTCEITSAVRHILREDQHLRDCAAPIGRRMEFMHESLRRLEQNLPSRDPAAFETANLDAFGYATVLSFLNDTDPLALMEMEDPVRNTIPMGLAAAALCRARGLKIVRVPACDHVKQRYAKVTHVNAYPVSILGEALADFV